MSTTFVTVPVGTTHVIGIDGKKYRSYTDVQGVCTVEMPRDCAAVLVNSDPVKHQISVRSMSNSSPTPPTVPA